ncbi:hypothetical protein [Rhizobium bangladeshense]|uniref:hypothetical protein n=1 Tax=Rhizobium bangladeshense TaxID=1138189 RepID=UPI002180D847|nr:hypothetical protein [Rhizobium bangladeshense]
MASYGDTSRLEELKLRMMASAMVLPDWLYKTQRRLMVDTVGVAIVDGASRPSDHAAGVWALSEIDDLLEIDGAAACMAELRQCFGGRVQQLLEAEARRALGILTPVAASAGAFSPLSPPFGALRGGRRMIPRCDPDGETFDSDGLDASDDEAVEGGADEDNETFWPPQRIRVGFARRLLDA